MENRIPFDELNNPMENFYSSVMTDVVQKRNTEEQIKEIILEIHNDIHLLHGKIESAKTSLRYTETLLKTLKENHSRLSELYRSMLSERTKRGSE